MTKTFCRCGKDSDLLKYLSLEVSFYGHQEILEILKPKSKHLPLEDMMHNAIKSDSSEAVLAVSDMMRKNGVRVTQEMMQTAKERKVTKIIETLTSESYNVDEEKEKRQIQIMKEPGKNIKDI